MAKGRKSRKRRRRTNPGALLVNPRRRRRRRNNPSRGHRRRRRRNPGIGSYAKQGLKDVMVAAIPATIGGIVIGFVDSKFLGDQGTVVRNIGKVITAVVVSTLGRRWLGPVGSAVAMGSILGTIGHEFGVRLGGGMVAMTKQTAVQELVEMAATDAETQAELGALIEGEPGPNTTTGKAIEAFKHADDAGVPSEYAELAAADDEMNEEDDYT